jgi:hypothetical protein
MTTWRVSIDLVRPLLVSHPAGAQLQWIATNKP